MSERNHKSMSVPREIAEKLEQIADAHGVKMPVILAALLDVAEAGQCVVEPFIERARQKNDAMRSKVASERAKSSHAKRKAMQVQTERVE